MPEEVVGRELDGFLRRDQRQVHRRSWGRGGEEEGPERGEQVEMNWSFNELLIVMGQSEWLGLLVLPSA